MALSTGTVIQGAAAVVRVNGVVVGSATGVNMTVAANAQQVKVLGSVLAQQIVHTGVDVSLTVDTFRLYNSSALAQGLFPRGNTAAVLNFPYSDWELCDRDTGAVIQRALKCKPTQMAMQLAQGGLMGQNLTIAATTYGDETPEAIEAAVQ